MRRALLFLWLLLTALATMGFEWEGRLGRLERELQSGDARRRQEVVRLMASYPASEVRDALLIALEDPDPAVRQEAAHTAGQVRLPDAAALLLGWLEDPDADVRASAAEALGAIGDPRPIPSLVRALGDASADVRRAAVLALAALDDPSVVVPLLGRLDDDDPEVRAEAAGALARLGDERAVVPLVGRGRDESPEVRTAVYRALGALGDRRAVAALIQSLRDESEDARLAAIAALGRLGSPRAVPPLVELLAERDPRVAQGAVAALGAVRGPEASGVLIEALGRADVRQTASEVLARRADPELTLRLADALQGADLGTTASLAEVLVKRLASTPAPEAAPAISMALRAGAVTDLLVPLALTGDPDVLVTLLEHLDSDQRAVQRAALEATERYFGLHPPDGRAADPLLAILGTVPATERVRVVRLLGEVRAARALPTIRELTEHEDESLRLAAVEAIGAIGDRAGADALLALLDSDDARTRFGAAIGLGAAADDGTVDALLTRLRAPPPVDRHAVLIALGGALANAPPDGEGARAAAAALRTSIAGPDEMLAARAIAAAGAWDSPVAQGLLEGAPRNLVAAATMELGLRPSGVPALRERLASRDPEVRLAATVRLGEHGGAEDVTRLLDILHQGAWPEPSAAAFSLARLARRGLLEVSAVPRLCAATSSRDVALRSNLAVALTALAASCPDGPNTPPGLPGSWTDRIHAPYVRAAAYRWASALGSEAEQAGASEGREGANATMLARCQDRELQTDVLEACRHPELPPLDARADVFAFGDDGRTLLRGQLISLRLADGSVLVAPLDANAHLRLEAAPRGELVLGDPLRTPLEP